MKHFFSLVFLLISSSLLMAQTVPAFTNTVSGIVWRDIDADGLRDSDELKLAGILVNLLDASNTVVSTTISLADGSFSLKVYAASYPTPTYHVDYIVPRAGFIASPVRVGGVATSTNSAATQSGVGSSVKFTSADFTITSSSDSPTTYGLGLVARPNTLTYCDVKGYTPTNWTATFLLPKSTVVPLPLSVTLYERAAVLHPLGSITNTGANATDYAVRFRGYVKLLAPGDATPLSINTQVERIGGGTSDNPLLATGQTLTWYNQFAFTVTEKTFADAEEITSYFKGIQGSTFSINAEATGEVALTTGGNANASVTTDATAGACVVYTYATGALPVKLASFTAKAEGQKANLNWATTEESNSDRFDVERSLDGKKWKTVGSVAAKGESVTNVPYSFADNTPVNGTNLYRLKMIDLDGSFAYSRINNVRFEGLPSISIYPNPVANQLSVSNLNTDEIAKIQIFNSNGNVVKETVKVSEPIDVTKIAGGIYSVRIIYTNGFADNRKVVIGH